MARIGSNGPVLMKPLGQVAELFSGVPTRADRGPGNDGPPIPVLSVSALGSPAAVPAMQYVTRAEQSTLDRYRVRAGDLLLSSRSTAPRVAVAPPSQEGLVANATLVVIRCGEQIEPELLAAYLRHPAGQGLLVGASQSGTSQMNLTVGALSAIPVPVPPRAEQQRLVEVLRAAGDAHVAAVEAAALRHSITQHIVFARMSGAEPVHA